MRPIEELRAIIKAGGSVRLPGVGVLTTEDALEEHYDNVAESLESGRDELEARRRAVRLGRGGLVAPGTASVRQALADRDVEIERLTAELESARNTDSGAAEKERFEARIKEMTEREDALSKRKQDAEKAAADAAAQVTTVAKDRDEAVKIGKEALARAEKAEKARAALAERVAQLEKEIAELKAAAAKKPGETPISGAASE